MTFGTACALYVLLNMGVQINHNKRGAAFQNDPADSRVRWMLFFSLWLPSPRTGVWIHLSGRRTVRRIWWETDRATVRDEGRRKGFRRGGAAGRQRFSPRVTVARESGVCRTNWFVARTVPPPLVRAAFFSALCPQECRAGLATSCTDGGGEGLLLMGPQRAVGQVRRIDSFRRVEIEKAVGGMKEPYALTTAVSVYGPG